MTVGQKIKFIRQFRNMTQKALGDALGYSALHAVKRISQYEHDTRTPKLDTILEMARIMKVSPYSIMTELDIDNEAIAIIENLFWNEEQLFAFQKAMNHACPAEILYCQSSNENSPINDITDLQRRFINNQNNLYETSIYYIIEILNVFKKYINLGQIDRTALIEWKLTWPYNKEFYNIIDDSDTSILRNIDKETYDYLIKLQTVENITPIFIPKYKIDYLHRST